MHEVVDVSDEDEDEEDEDEYDEDRYDEDEYDEDEYGQPSDRSDSGDSSDFRCEKHHDMYVKDGPLADLGKALAAAQTEPAEFSFGGPANFLPSTPDLEIEGVGSIPLPLIDDQIAERVIQACDRAPFGRGFGTFIDTSVRNSWQLDPSKIRLTHPGGRQVSSRQHQSSRTNMTL